MTFFNSTVMNEEGDFDDGIFVVLLDLKSEKAWCTFRVCRHFVTKRKKLKPKS